jgi:DNA polymerase III subunit gamma/tau
MSFDTKYRPIRFEDVIGQEDTINILRELLRRGEVFQKSYVFAGPSGTGKTTTARILARSMLCEDVDPETAEPCNECNSCKQILERGDSPAFKEMDAANNTGADNVRKIVEGLDYYTLGGGDRKIYLIDECHRLSTQAMDALLKPMEDSVPGSKDKRLVCLFCTTEPQKLRGTIKGRCMVFGIKEPKRDEIVERLRYISEQEEIQAEDEALDLIFSYGRGHIRDMVTALERVSRVGPVTESSVRKQLGLDVVSKQYEILLHLADSPDKSMAAMMEALTQTDPDSIYEGIADAAMSSYRISKGITIGLSYVEQDLAEKISARYDNDTLLTIAHRILNVDRKMDRNSLSCELLVLQSQLERGVVTATPETQVVQVPVQGQPSGSQEASSEEAPRRRRDARSKGEIEAANREAAEKAMPYGGKAARGSVEGTPEDAVFDPVDEFRGGRAPVKSGERTIPAKSAKEEDYSDVKKSFSYE